MKRSIFLFVVLALILAWCGRDGVRVHAQTSVAPDQIRGLSHVLVMSCTGAFSPTQICTGFLYVDIVKPDGTHITVLGGAPPAGFVIDPTKWSQVPTQ